MSRKQFIQPVEPYEEWSHRVLRTKGEVVDKNGRILEQHGSVSTGIYAMKDLPDRNLAGCFLTGRRTNEKGREAVYVQDEVVSQRRE